MKYFAHDRITIQQVNELKRLRRKNKKNKIIKYGNNFLETVYHEKGISVYDDEDEILQLIQEYLEPWAVDPGTRSLDLFLAGKPPEELYYNYRKLPYKLRQYMYSVDSLLFDQWYYRARLRPNFDRYDAALEKLENQLPDYNDDDFIAHVLCGKSYDTPVAKKARDSARQAYKTVSGILKTNIQLFTRFVTLTFAPEKNRFEHLSKNENRSPGEQDLRFKYAEATDFQQAKDMYSNFRKNLQQTLFRRGIDFKFLTVWELQKNGNYHFHMLTSDIPDDLLYDVPGWLDVTYGKRQFGKGALLWNYGKSDVQHIKNYQSMSTYVSKYILKSFYNLEDDKYEQYLNKKKYFVSKGLDRPEEIYKEQESKEENAETVTPYIKTYHNPYNGGVIKKSIYTLIKNDYARGNEHSLSVK